MLDLSIVIVNYNAKEFLKKCLISIVKNAKHVSYEIIVIDNKSSDGSTAMIKEEFPQVKLTANKDNVGFSKANNQGVGNSKESRYILFLNPDTVIHEKMFEEMRQIEQQERAEQEKISKVNPIKKSSHGKII